MPTPGPRRPLAGVVMGSDSDRQVMEHATAMLEQFGIETDVRVLSAHRTPDALDAWVTDIDSRGAVAIIAGAGGAAALPGAVAARTLLPVLGVPVKGWALDGLDSLLSMAQMPGGIPVATFSIGKVGAMNAALFVVSMLAIGDDQIHKLLAEFRARQRREVLEGSGSGEP